MSWSGGFDAFGDGVQTEGAAQGQDGGGDRGVSAPCAEGEARGRRDPVAQATLDHPTRLAMPLSDSSQG
jgi:hypothetical protein